MHLPDIDRGSIIKLQDVARDMQKHRKIWDDLVRRRDGIIAEVVKDNPKATRVDIGLALGVSDTIVRRALKKGEGTKS